MKKEIIIIILSILVIFLGGYIIYEKVYLTNENETTNEKEEQKDNTSKYNIKDYITISKYEKNECTDCETITTLEIVNFNNLPLRLTTEFENKQEELINTATINTTNEVKYEIYNNILSIYTAEKIEAMVGQDTYNFYSLNIDLKNQKIYTNEELIELFGIKSDDIFKKILNNIVKTVDTEEFLLTTDGDITKETITLKNFEKNIDTYINYINNRSDVLTLTIQDSKLVAYYSQSKILEILGMGTHMDSGLIIEPQSVKLN